MERDKLDLLYDQLLLVTKKMTSNFEEEAKKTGYNKSEYIIIRDILDHPKTTQHSVCVRTGLKKSAVSKSLNRLIETDVVVRNTCDSDRREIELSIDNEEIQQTFCKAELLQRMFSGCIANRGSIDGISEQLALLIDLLGET